MFRSILAIVLLLSVIIQKDPARTAPLTGQPCVWDSTLNWRIYKLNDFRRVFAIPVDSMKFMESVPINNDSIRRMLCTSKKLDIQGDPIWMGCFLASYQTLSGKPIKVIISVYGGFFVVQQKHTYFEVDQAIQKDWLTYLSGSYMKMEH